MRLHLGSRPTGYNSQHKCIRSLKNSNTTFTWIVRKLRSKLYVDPDLRYSSMQQDLLEKFGVQVSQKKLYRVKRKAREEDYDSHARYSKKILVYVNVVLETNPGSIAKNCWVKGEDKKMINKIKNCVRPMIFWIKEPNKFLIFH